RGMALNLPAVGSISITLEALFTRTRVILDPSAANDSLVLNGKPASAENSAKAFRFVDLMRSRAGTADRATIVSDNNFPTGAGLASSASGFAALAVATDAALGLKLPPRELSELSRRGSGSAARSIFGGFVELHMGTKEDGSDCLAEEIAPSSHWPLKVFVAVVTDGPKETGSTIGMDASKRTSPYYHQWVETHPVDLAMMRVAIADKDFDQLSHITERSCMKMHAVMLATDPALLYWRGASIEVVHAVRALQKQGVAATYTIDAGPQVKVITTEADAARVKAAIASVPGVLRLMESNLGPNAVVESAGADA
ncbi:MAG: diphosphomevalonate decarboxylase, partial [Clostridia bacterium]|nr:diphosphomevalonate decarboxylase [Deltaproteobacteria bacterium]